MEPKCWDRLLKLRGKDHFTPYVWRKNLTCQKNHLRCYLWTQERNCKMPTAGLPLLDTPGWQWQGSPSNLKRLYNGPKKQQVKVLTLENRARHGPKGERNKTGEPYNRPNSPPENSFNATEWKWESQTEPPPVFSLLAWCVVKTETGVWEGQASKDL